MNSEAVDEGPARRALPIALVIVASVLTLVSAFAIWAKRQLLETDTWVDTSTELLQNEAIRDALATFLVTEVYDNVNVEAEIARRLPPRLEPVAGPISGGLRQLADDVARRVLADPRVQNLWEQANRGAHEELLAVIDDETTAISTGGGNVTLELGTILNEVTQQLGISADLASKLPPQAAELEIMKSNELETAQTGVSILRTLAWALAALALVLYALAIYLAGGRRRETLRAAGVSFVLVGALLLVLHRLAGNAIVSSLSDVANSDDAVDAVWTIGTSQLTEIANALFLYGIFIVIAAWLAGPTSIATSIRGAVAPWFRQPAYAYGGLLVLLILLFWWDPTQGTHRLVPSLLLIVLLVLGTEVLRRQVIREFPDRVRTSSSEGIAQALASRMREARERRVAKAPAPNEADGGDRIAGLTRLAELRDADVLSEEEFATEKRRLLESA